jgi:hypothetical protein
VRYYRIYVTLDFVFVYTEDEFEKALQDIPYALKQSKYTQEVWKADWVEMKTHEFEALPIVAGAHVMTR